MWTENRGNVVWGLIIFFWLHSNLVVGGRLVNTNEFSTKMVWTLEFRGWRCRNIASINIESKEQKYPAAINDLMYRPVCTEVVLPLIGFLFMSSKSEGERALLSQLLSQPDPLLRFPNSNLPIYQFCISFTLFTNLWPPLPSFWIFGRTC